MINARPLRAPSPSTAALVRLSAFLVAAASAVLIPSEFCSAAYGHTRIASAVAIAAVAAILTLVTALAARSLDPMRR